MHRAQGLEHRRFEAAIEATDGRGLYVETGHFARHLRRFYEHLARSQTLVILFDDLAARPATVFRRAARFVGADPDVVPDVVGSKVNVHVMFRSRRVRPWAQRLPDGIRDATLRALATVNTRETARPSMASETEQRLRSHCEEHDAALTELLDRDVPWRARTA